MKINFVENKKLNKNEILVEIQYSEKSKELENFVEYINNYELKEKNKVIVINDNYEFEEIRFDDVIIFYSDKKYNYCKTNQKRYRVKSKLYELEIMHRDFMRISKSCIVNIKHVKKFDISETGKIFIKLDDHTEEIVSRRKTKEIMKYLDDRRI